MNVLGVFFQVVLGIIFTLDPSNAHEDTAREVKAVKGGKIPKQGATPGPRNGTWRSHRAPPVFGMPRSRTAFRVSGGIRH